MLEPKRTYEAVDYESLNQFLLGTLAEIRRDEITIEKAVAISQITDKIVKNNLTAIMEAKRINDTEKIKFFEPQTKQVLIG